MKTVLFAVGAAVLICIGGTVTVEAHWPYFNGVIDVLSYDVTEYANFDLVRMTVQIENLQSGDFPLHLRLAIDDRGAYLHRTYSDVRGMGAEVSVNDCASNGRAPYIPENGVANMTACFMVGSGFGDYPSALNVEFGSHGKHCDSGSHSCHASGHLRGSLQVVRSIRSRCIVLLTIPVTAMRTTYSV